MAESEKLANLNKKIAEIKKKILLSEGQKKANFEEWEKTKCINNETITTLKKDIKESTAKLMFLKNPTSRKSMKQPQEVIRRIQYPLGAETADEAVNVMDLKVTEVKKQIDLLHDRYIKRQKVFSKRIEEYNELLNYKNYKSQESGGQPPPETLEEDANRKLVCQLENEIHRTNVQWMEAEHIRKKYRSIKASLMNDSERFEKSLRELEEALTEQQGEINRLQQVNKEAIEMRDAARIILQRQEQYANQSGRAREMQSLDFRKQVEERKLELERIERKLFSTAAKTLVHQDSIGSSSGDQQTAKTEVDDDPDSQLKNASEEMDVLFKRLMEVSGATAPHEVLERFLSQQESSKRLEYLRTAAEAEKKHLENQRELLNNELEQSKFSDNKETEINQEQLEQLKTEINVLAEQEIECQNAADRTTKVIKSIEKTIVEMIFKLQEVNENDTVLKDKKIRACDLEAYLTSNNIDYEELINILEEKLNDGLKASGLLDKDEGIMDDMNEEIKIDELYVPLGTSRPVSATSDRPQPLPICYLNLSTGRAGQTSSGTPGQTTQPVPTDDESEVPSRNFLKRQALLIVDSKSRRKGFRAPTQRRK